MPNSAEKMRRRGYVQNCRDRRKKAGKTREEEYATTNLWWAIKRENKTADELAAEATLKKRRARLDRLLKKHPNAKELELTPDKAAGLPAGARISVPIEEAELQLYPNGRRNKALFLNIVDEDPSGNQVSATQANMMGDVNATPGGSKVVGAASNFAQNEPCSSNSMNLVQAEEWQLNNPNAQLGHATPFESGHYLDELENLPHYGHPTDTYNNYYFDDEKYVLQEL